MMNRTADKSYCGVDRKKIFNASPQFDQAALAEFHLFIQERYLVHLKKDVQKLEAPWTEYAPLKEYKFTNVRREHDRQSKWLIQNISLNPKLTITEKIYNSILFRTWNKSETFSLLGGPFSLSQLQDPLFILQKKGEIERYSQSHQSYTWYTNAFNCGGLKASWGFPAFDLYECTDSGVRITIKAPRGEILVLPMNKAKHFLRENEDSTILDVEGKLNVRTDYPRFVPNIPERMFWLARHAIDMNLSEKLEHSEDQCHAFEILKLVRGFSDFLAYQVFVDLTYIPEFPFSENEFTVAGPGCMRGIDRLFTNKSELSYEECLFYIRDNQNNLFNKFGYDPQSLFSDLPEWDRYLNVMSLENCFCEFSKLMKLKDKQGRPRMRYRPQVTKGFF